ncbi:HNH endonuclease [Paenibacillus sp. FSL R7-0337]|uniref:HNH endonuclease n=1 Tax=Paenibacillus sp. FSL R7-0337 TaxID=1926588 RepID=UPI0009FA39B1|nr:HNH endonuclease [Paenibacillus sp. FSL R7-0337]
MIIRNGKIVIKSLQKGLMKGAKNLRDLLDRILQKFKFKKFELERIKNHIILYGIFNPRIKLIDLKTKDPDKFQSAYDNAMEDAARKQSKYNKKPNKPRNYKKMEPHEDGTTTYTFLSKKSGKEYRVKYDAEGYPILDSKHDITLPEKYYLESDKVQFDYLSKELYKEILENPELAKKFTAAERNLLKEGKVPDTFTWHHHQEAGRMQIIDYFEHQVSGHTGGRAIWGGGRKGRKGKIKKNILEMMVWE